ncbi:general substrate transporter [Abortiporus biennis]|nr:general substrate transporter [Abortiporus biennis]
MNDSRSFTVRGWGVCLWILVVSFQYGYHISALNQIQAVLTCRKTETEIPLQSVLPTCIPMSDATFSVVTAVYTVGGLLGSSGANVVMDKWGRKGAVKASAVVGVVGAGLMAMASSLTLLILGRTLVGAAAGLGLCVGPIFLSEIAPPNIKGTVGVLTQFAIVCGIMITQTLGLQLATPHQWRIVLVFSALLGIFQLAWSPLIVESPVWIARHGSAEQKLKVARILWGPKASLAEDLNVESADPLLQDPERNTLNEDDSHDSHVAALTVPQALTSRAVRRPLTIVCFSMLCQQLSGVNAVLYYSNDILSKALPDLGPFVSLGITIVNVIMTFPPIFLIERIGRKQLLTLSATGAFLALVGVGLGLDSELIGLASFSIIAFIASFAVGVGPVPFVMIPEVSPPHAVSALSSVALSLNWISNFLVGLVFLPLRNILAHGDATKEGRVFYVFAGLLAFCTFVLLRVYRG